MKSVLRIVFSIVIPVIFVSLIFFSLPLVCGQAHEHVHSHSHEDIPIHNEKPSYKWSQEANEEHYSEFKEPYNNPVHASTIHSSQWIEALGATVLISIAPYIILFFIPVSNKKEHEPYLKVLLAFASGGLLGDAFLHLIPHALMSTEDHGSHSHSHSHSHSEESHSHDNTVGMSVLGGIITFLVVEKFVRICNVNHSHSYGDKKENIKGSSARTADGKGKKVDDVPANKQVSGVENMKVAGYLNLAADFAHNLTDGLAIGASFMAGRSIGIVTTFTIFLHEIPHEIGDFAILLQSGCSRRKAMKLQLVTALGAVVGTVISLVAGAAGAASVSWILPFTAGGFIYIATVSVIPELLENSSLWQSVSEVMAILMGVSLMIAITLLEGVSN